VSLRVGTNNFTAVPGVSECREWVPIYVRRFCKLIILESKCFKSKFVEERENWRRVESSGTALLCCCSNRAHASYEYFAAVAGR